MPSSKRPPLGAAPASSSAADEPRRPQVLIVDDQPGHAAHAEAVFTRFGCAVTLAGGGEAALAACAAATFDLVVLDCELVEAIVDRLRAAAGAAVAFVCCSPTPAQMVRADIDHVLAKPLTAPDAAATLDAVLKGLPVWSYLAPILLMDEDGGGREED